jgi:hypothetical protein
MTDLTKDPEVESLRRLLETTKALGIDACDALIALLMEQSAALRDVAAERQRQVSVEGWTQHDDDSYSSCELAAAAATYALCTRPEQLQVCGVTAWPWHQVTFKPTTYRRNLIKAGALILAEIERLDRAAAKTQIEIVSLDWAKAPEWADKYGRAGDCGSKVWFSDSRYRYESNGSEYAISEGIHKAGTYSLAEITLLANRPAQP